MSARSASESDASVVSAPSLTSTMPASGSPASSWRTPSRAAPSLVWEPAKPSSLGEASREAVDEKRNVRRTNLSASAFISAASGAPNACRTNAPRDSVPQSVICMLRESSTITARKFCCVTAALTISTGRKRQTRTSASVARRSAVSTSRSPTRALTDTRR